MKDYIETFTGLQANPVNLNSDDICIEDIAHSLSLICRYNGHCREFFSVAQHCVMVADCTHSFGVGKVALLHDSGEAYLSDVPSPLKRLLTNYEEIEAGVLEVVYQKFLGRSPTQYEWDIVKGIDDSIWMTEVFNLFDDWRNWEFDESEHLFKIDIWDSATAEKEFLAAAKRLDI